jgi:hypothetical protein
MKPGKDLSFLQDKIQGIGSALFYNLSSGVLKFPTSIVTVLKVDEAYNIWFFANRPEQNLQSFDREFPVRMQLYRKGKGYHLQISGKAYIVDDPEDVYSVVSLPEEIKIKAFRELALVKVKISHVEYYEYTRRFARRRSLKGLFRQVYDRLFREDTRPEPYIFQPAARLGF